jgi:hypothetical protein
MSVSGFVYSLRLDNGHSLPLISLGALKATLLILFSKNTFLKSTQQ